ncbi:MAG: AAA family ATPase [Bryobacteraceae bacterium]
MDPDLPPIYNRAIDIDLPRGQSAFVWGPRKVGKSTFLRARYPDSIFLDLLDSRLRFDMARQPAVLREILDAETAERRAKPIILDEVQKVPELLDEVHGLIESRKLSFILCGSSARKLRRGQANLLGGRAWRFEMFPLVSAEVPNLDLLRALSHGLIPSHYDSTRPNRSLQAFVDDYLKEEIVAEAQTRNLASFVRFLDVTGITNGQIVNYTKIASDVGVDAKTVKSYFQILVDTLIGRFLEPLPAKPGSRKNLTASPKFYLFDPGVARFIRHSRIEGLDGSEAGHLFETFLVNELLAALAYKEIRKPVHFYRTKDDAEVDFIVNHGEVAIEAKLSQNVRSPDLRGLNNFLDYEPTARAIVVCLEARRRVVTANGKTIEIFPWKEFCSELWAGKICG